MSTINGTTQSLHHPRGGPLPFDKGRKEKETLSQEQGALTVMKKNFDLFIACLKELPEQNAAGMPLKVNGPGFSQTTRRISGETRSARP